MQAITFPKAFVVDEIIAKTKELRLGTVIPTGLALAALAWATTFEHRQTINEADVAQVKHDGVIFYEKFSQNDNRLNLDRDAFRKDLKEGLDKIGDKVQELTTALAVQKALADRAIHK